MRAASLLLMSVLLVSPVLVSCSGPAKSAKIAEPETTVDGDGTPPGTLSEDVPFHKNEGYACMLHEEAGKYYSCLTGADGACFHWGANCFPEDKCVIDLSDNKYKLCAEVESDRCAKFAGECRPKGECLFDTGQHRYRTCTNFSGGQCKAFSELCLPAAG